MFARSCPRMGMRFASGNVFYMNRTFTTRHLNSVASPLSAGFITPMRFASSMVPLTGFSAADGCIVAELSKISEPVGVGRMGDYNIMQVLNGFAMVPTNVLKDAFVCASEV